jgi:hypothetical protein
MTAKRKLVLGILISGLILVLYWLKTFYIAPFSLPDGPKRLEEVEWRKLTVFYETVGIIKGQNKRIVIDSPIALNRLRDSLHIKEWHELPTISYTVANKIDFELSNNEKVRMIVGQSSLTSHSGVICYNLKNPTESYGLIINTEFLMKLKHYIERNTKEKIRFPLGHTD